MIKKFSKLMSDTKSQIQEAQRTPSRINAKKKERKKGKKERNTPGCLSFLNYRQGESGVNDFQVLREKNRPS